MYAFLFFLSGIFITVWSIFLLMNVFFALKGSKLLYFDLFLLQLVLWCAAAIKLSPYIINSAEYIYVRFFEISDDILRTLT